MHYLPCFSLCLFYNPTTTIPSYVCVKLHVCSIACIYSTELISKIKKAAVNTIPEIKQWLKHKGQKTFHPSKGQMPSTATIIQNSATHTVTS